MRTIRALALFALAYAPLAHSQVARYVAVTSTCMTTDTSRAIHVDQNWVYLPCADKFQSSTSFFGGGQSGWALLIYNAANILQQPGVGAYHGNPISAVDGDATTIATSTWLGYHVLWNKPTQSTGFTVRTQRLVTNHAAYTPEGPNVSMLRYYPYSTRDVELVGQNVFTGVLVNWDTDNRGSMAADAQYVYASAGDAQMHVFRNEAPFAISRKNTTTVFGPTGSFQLELPNAFFAYGSRTSSPPVLHSDGVDLFRFDAFNDEGKGLLITPVSSMTAASTRQVLDPGVTAVSSFTLNNVQYFAYGTNRGKVSIRRRDTLAQVASIDLYANANNGTAFTPITHYRSWSTTTNGFVNSYPTDLQVYGIGSRVAGTSVHLYVVTRPRFNVQGGAAPRLFHYTFGA